METITSIANTATKAVWGDGTERDEPVSGVQGDVTKGEPYDGGNIEVNKPTRRDSKLDPESSNDPQKNSNTTNTATAQTPDDTHATPPAEQPSRTTTTADSKDEAVVGEGGKQELTGKAPRPLATVAKENGGDAGNVQTGPDAATPASSSEDTNTEAGKNEKSHTKGTGELHVKTSGLAADGGDFDATKPGAGREADRLMEQKGIEREANHHSTTSNPKPVTSRPVAENEQEKNDIKERIKDKLHLHKS